MNLTEHKQSKIALKQAKDWQQKIFEGSLDAIFISDEDSCLVAVNNAACDLTGYSKEQLLKMRIPDLHEDPDLEAYRKYHKGIFKGEEILSEAKLLRRDGVKVDTEFNNSCISISGKLYMHTTARDITEHKRTERALRESEERFRSLFENSLFGISIVSTDGKLLQVNPAFARMYGYENPEIMSSEVTTAAMLYSNPAEREEVLRILNRNGKMEEKEIEVRRRDGSRFFVLVSANEVRDTNGKLLYNQATHIDLTERRKTEKKIRDASLYARTLIEASLDPLVTINSEGKITDVNLANEQITGINREKLIGSDFADYFKEPDKAREGYSIVFSNGVVKDYPLTILHKGGRTIDVLYNATLFENEAGEVQGVLTARDITDRKKMEMELRNSKELLEKLNQHLQEVRENERSQIALNLHDDLGQKLTALNLDIAWLKSRMGVQSPAVSKKFKDMSLMINETIEGIKEISSFLRPAILFDLGLVPAINTQLSGFGKQSGIKCHFYCEPVEFIIDDRLSLILYRILQESLTNIARHSGASTAEVNLRILKNKIEMLIKDNGIGIDKDKVSSLTSMGIAGIKERVRSVNGKLSISGEKGSGTIIKVLIPLSLEKNYD